ncbi:MAG: Zn-dependent hydrolase or glyoxylase [Pseudomonadota bacterium]|jgi:glyoxylase-like metal-dependent hydrolase (beta-lactamase superfamily II)
MNMPLARTLQHALLASLIPFASSTAVVACPVADPELVRIDANVWIRPAKPGDPAGWSEPVVVWVGTRELWIADPGPHRCAGLALRKALLRLWPGHTHQLINTHSHPRNVLANSAWPASTPIYALASVRQQMRQRCPVCLANLRRELGEDWMQGTTVRLPNRVLRPMQWLTLGSAQWQVRPHANAHTEADTSLHSPALAMVYAPSLLSWHRVPDLARAQPAAWLSALEELKHLQPNALWLGHTNAEVANADFTATHTYLQALWQTLAKAYEEGRSEHEFHTSPALLPEPWRDEASRRTHLLNVQRVWHLQEQQDLRSDPR